MNPRQLAGRRMREARDASGMSQKSLGEQLGKYLGKEWAPQAVSAAERGMRQFDPEVLIALSIVLKQPVSWFLTPGPGEQIDMPGGLVLEAGDIVDAARRGSATAGLALSEQVEESLLYVKRAVRKLEGLRRGADRAVAASLSPSPSAAGRRPPRRPRKGATK